MVFTVGERSEVVSDFDRASLFRRGDDGRDDFDLAEGVFERGERAKAFKFGDFSADSDGGKIVSQAGLPVGVVFLEMEFEDVGRAGLWVGYDPAPDALTGEGFLVSGQFGRTGGVNVEPEAAVRTESGVFPVVEAAALAGEAEEFRPREEDF